MAIHLKKAQLHKHNLCLMEYFDLVIKMDELMHICDHLFTVTQLAEKMAEFQLPLWVAVVDFQKAFDCVEHAALWKAMAEQGVPRGYIRICRALYKDQTGKVNTKTASRSFDIARGFPRDPKLAKKQFLCAHIYI